MVLLAAIALASAACAAEPSAPDPAIAAIQADRAYKGRLVGIGVKLSVHADGARIEGVLPGTPAEKANIRAGQVILAVDGQSIKGMAMQDVVKLITGEEGTDVKLEIAGSDGAKSTVSITRGVVKMPGVAAQVLDNGIGRLTIAAINMETPAAVKQALTETLASGTARGIIIDLRNNTGGVYREVVKIAQMLIDGDPAKSLWTVRQNGKSPEFVRATSPALNKLPCVVIVDKTTSGGAELLAEALQEQSRAALVGSKTAGAAELKNRVAKIRRQLPSADHRRLLLPTHRSDRQGPRRSRHIGPSQRHARAGRAVGHPDPPQNALSLILARIDLMPAA